jgi:hypothetical protein
MRAGGESKVHDDYLVRLRFQIKYVSQFHCTFFGADRKAAFLECEQFMTKK